MIHDEYIFWLGLAWSLTCLGMGIAYGYYTWVYKPRKKDAAVSEGLR